MKQDGMFGIALISFLALAFPTLGQSRNRFEGWCQSLRNASSADLVRFLNATVPNEANARCVTWAIQKLGQERYEPAIPPLLRLLDFRRPPTPQEKLGFYLHPQTIDEVYPATSALEEIGKKALPEVLAAIKANPASPVARQNAIFVWMEIYRQSDEQPKGVALLKQEEDRAKDDATKQRLRWAVQKALEHCNPPQKSACEGAARTGNYVHAP